jgi:hypothetical protein
MMSILEPTTQLRWVLTILIDDVWMNADTNAIERNDGPVGKLGTQDAPSRIGVGSV